MHRIIMKNIYYLLTLLSALLLFSVTVSADTTTGLVAYYPFNGNANDESGNGNNGTINGAALAADKFGRINKACSFDGADDYVNIGGSVPSTLQIQNEITLEAWIYVTQYPPSNTL